MSKKIYLFSLVLLALTFTACSETEETGRMTIGVRVVRLLLIQ